MNNQVRRDLFHKRIQKLKEQSIAGRKIVSRKPVATRPQKVMPKREVSPPPPPLKNYITLDVVQGLGDIFWVYQKIAPHFKTINLNICVVVLDHVQNRSLPWMPLLPQVGEVKLRLVDGEVYNEMVTTRYNLSDTIKNWQESHLDSVPYAVNKWLEDGIRLDEIDNMKVMTDVPLKMEPINVPFKKYMTLYVSGSAKNRNLPCWSIDQWLEYVDLLYSKYNPDLPIVVIGANFDREAIEEVSLGLCHRRIETVSYMNESPAKVAQIIANSKLFVGYQSGLNIIADNLDVPQVMLYYDHLKPMMYTWCKKKNIETKFFADLFSSSPESVMKKFDLTPFLK
jgi:hypothetical protein